MLTLLTYEPIDNLSKNPHIFYMLERQEHAAMVLLLIVLITVTAAYLILGSFGKQPFARAFTNDSPDGELVVVSGTIDHVVITQNGGHMNVYTDTTTIFVPAQVAQGLTLQKGETISVYGIVQTYRGKKEIVVNSVQDILAVPERQQ